MDGPVRLLLFRQAGVVARRQLLASGLTADDVRRLLRRRELVRVHPGVYVDHTGPLSHREREIAAVLAYQGSALASSSALPGRKMTGPVIVGVEAKRSLRPVKGVRLVERTGWASQVLAAVNRRKRLPRRRMLVGILGDLGAGSESWLEREWMHLTRAHGLPRGAQQVTEPTPGGTARRDVRYERFCVDVEIDGRGTHGSTAAWDADHERDLVSLAAGRVTIRLTYGQVFRRGCATVRRVAAVLQQRGWEGAPTSCGRC